MVNECPKASYYTIIRQMGIIVVIDLLGGKCKCKIKIRTQLKTFRWSAMKTRQDWNISRIVLLTSHCFLQHQSDKCNRGEQCTCNTIEIEMLDLRITNTNG